MFNSNDYLESPLTLKISIIQFTKDQLPHFSTRVFHIFFRAGDKTALKVKISLTDCFTVVDADVLAI